MLGAGEQLPADNLFQDRFFHSQQMGRVKPQRPADVHRLEVQPHFVAHRQQPADEHASAAGQHVVVVGVDAEQETGRAA